MALPSTPMLDDISRPDENTLSWKGAWAQVDTTLALPQLSGKKIHGPSGVGYAYWTRGTNIVQSEVFVTVPTVGAFYVGLRLSGLGGTNAADGYWLSYASGVIRIYRMTNVAVTSIANVNFTMSAGDQAVFRAMNSLLTGYVVRGKTVIQLLSVADSTYAQGAIGVAVQDATVQLSNFGGGTIDSLVL